MKFRLISISLITVLLFVCGIVFLLTGDSLLERLLVFGFCTFFGLCNSFIIWVHVQMIKMQRGSETVLKAYKKLLDTQLEYLDEFEELVDKKIEEIERREVRE